MSTQENIKMIDIREATEGEAQKIEHHFTNYDSFKQELKIINQVNNIFDDPRVKIKKDGNRYIFNIDGKNKFTIPEGKMESRVWKYCKEMETREAEEDLLIRITGFKLEYIKVTTKEDLAMLKDDITRLKNQEAKETDMESTKKVLARNIKFLEGEKEYSKDVDKDDKIDRNLRKAYRSQVQDRLDRLYRMKETMERLEKNDAKNYTIKRENVNGKNEIQEVKMDDINAYNKQETLMQINQRLEEIAREEDDFRATRDMIINRETSTIPYYEIIINDKSDARKLRNSLKKVNKQYVILDKLSLDAAKKQELAQDLQDLEEYLNNVITQPDAFKPSERPFIPKHTKEFYELVKIDPTLSEFFSLNITKTKVSGSETSKAGKTEAKNTNKTTENTENTETEKENQGEGNTESMSKNYDSGKEAFAKGGIGGVMGYRLDKTNMTENQKQMRGGMGNLALTGGMIFVGFKMISSAIKLLTKKGRSEENLGKNLGRLLGPTAVIFGAQARSGEGPMSLFKGGKTTEKISKLFGRGSGNPDIAGKKFTQAEIYTEGFIGLMGAFDMMNYQGMANILEETNDGKLKIREDQYDGYIAMLEAGNDNQKAGAKFLKKHVGKEDKNGVMDLTLRSMGITSMEDLTNNPTKEFSATAGLAATKVYSVHAFMEKEGYNRINPETMPLIQAYIEDENSTVDDLEDLKERGDVFDITEATTDKTGLSDKIKLIAPTDATKQRYLLNGINDFYEYRPATDKSGLDIIGTGPIVEFKTYGYTTKIDLDSKKIEGLSTTEKFPSYAELFKAANLTNRLKHLCKDRTAIKEDPFYTQSDDLMFDDAKVFSTDFDTEMVEEKTLNRISSTLFTFKEDYCKYLNTLKFRKTATA